MIVYTGKHNTATVFVDNIDTETASQIQNFVNHEAFAGGRIAVMPDCHAGKGSCIGFTYQLGDKVIPNIVGVDIGCGMLAYQLPETKLDCQRLDNVIRKVVPSGFTIHDDPSKNRAWLSDADADRYVEMASRVGQRASKAIESLGTLGGGNHFIEVDRAPDGTLWLVVHSGSRNLGLCVAEFHQNVARQSMTGGQKGMEYLTGQQATAYTDDMQTAQRYAEHNRLFIIRRIVAEAFGVKAATVETDGCVSCVHNYINFTDRIIRKGAISAHAGERVIIPLNMRDGIIFGRGKGNEAWNWSAPHGAGRILSRGQAKRQLSISEFRKTMEGVWTSCVSEATLDESPMAYKPMAEIMAVIGETVDVEFVATPVYNFKAS